MMKLRNADPNDIEAQKQIEEENLLRMNKRKLFLKVVFQNEKKMKEQGVTKWTIGDDFVWARTKEKAMEKARKRGLI